MIAAAGGLGAWLGLAAWLGGVVLFGALLYRMRKWLTSASAASSAQVWTLQDLRGMLSEGRISQLEYEALRQQLMGLAGKGKTKDESGAKCEAGETQPDVEVNEIKPPDEEGR